MNIETGTMTTNAKNRRNKLRICFIEGVLRGTLREFSSYEKSIKIGRKSRQLKIDSDEVSRHHGYFRYDGI